MPLLSSRYQVQHFQLLREILHSTHAVCWQWDIEQSIVTWDDQITRQLGYDPAQIVPSVEQFFAWMHPEDQEQLRPLLQEHLRTGSPYQLPVRLRNSEGRYRWYETTGQAQFVEGKPVFMLGILRDVHEERVTARKMAEYSFLVEAAGRLTKVGGWRLKLQPKQVLRWTDEVYRIHELPLDTEIDTEMALGFYHPQSVPVITEALQNCIHNQQKFDLQLQVITARNRHIWVHVIGKPILTAGKTVAVEGVFQDITEQKLKQLKLEQSLSIISEQNKRLQTFAQMVSHNLRSHASTLKSVLELRRMSDDLMDQTFFDESLTKISDALSNTIQELNDIVQIQNKPSITQRKLVFDEVFRDVLVVLGSIIRRENARVDSSFVNCPTLVYSPAYLESILLNLVSNAIKYRRPDLPVHVQVRTFLVNGKCVLEVKDNGLGMDLETVGGKLFGMYQTFHGNSEATGLGLYLIQSQIEALGGHIDVSSKVNEGSKFTIYFNK